MTPAFAVEATIDKPAPAVWSVLTNWDRAHEWMGGIESMTAHGPTDRGTRLTFHARGKDRDSEIAACEPGRSVVLRSVQGGVTADYHYELLPIDELRTRVRLVAACETRGLWTLVSPLLRIAVKLADGSQLDTLKRVVEGDE